MRECPEVTIQTDVSAEMFARLREGALDLVFNYLSPVPHEGTESELLLDDEFVAYASRRHALARRRKLGLGDVAGERWAVTSVLRQELARRFRMAGLPAPKIGIETRSIKARLTVVAEGGLLGITSRRLLQHVGADHELVRLPLPELNWPRPFGVIWRQGGYVSPIGQRLIALVRANLRPGSTGRQAADDPGPSQRGKRR
jgi:DNA-binding transcriptional LysR family regulator